MDSYPDPASPKQTHTPCYTKVFQSVSSQIAEVNGSYKLEGLCIIQPPLYTHYTLFYYEKEMDLMLRWALIFLVIALIAGIFGFFNIVAAAASVAKVLFFVFIVLFVISLITGRRRSM